MQQKKKLFLFKVHRFQCLPTARTNVSNMWYRCTWELKTAKKYTEYYVFKKKNFILRMKRTFDRKK